MSGEQKIKVKFIITNDNEGHDFESAMLDPKDIETVKQFREHPVYGKYPITHFMNAAYFTDQSLNNQETLERIHQTINSNIDEIGIHIHPWKPFIEALEIKYRSGPSYLSRGMPIIGNKKSIPVGPENMIGGDVATWRYSKKEIIEMIRKSKNILEEQGFKNITSFRAGGWQTDKKVLEALLESGLSIDSSPVPYKLVENLYPKTRLANHVKKLWGNTSVTSQPEILKISNRKSIKSVPNNAGLADYVDADMFKEILLENINKARKEGKKEIVIVSGFHLESAAQYMKNLEDSIDILEEYATELNYEIEPTTLQALPNDRFQSKGNCAKRLISLFN